MVLWWGRTSHNVQKVQKSLGQANASTLRLQEADTGPEVIMAKEFSNPLPGETRRIIGNLFYRGYIAGDTFGFTEISGNIDINGNPVTG